MATGIGGDIRLHRGKEAKALKSNVKSLCRGGFWLLPARENLHAIAQYGRPRSRETIENFRSYSRPMLL